MAGSRRRSRRRSTPPTENWIHAAVGAVRTTLRDRSRAAGSRGSRHRREAAADREGPARKPVEFGYKGQIVDNDDGIVLDYDVQAGPAGRTTTGPRPCSGSRPGSGGYPAPSLPTEGTAKPPSTRHSLTSVSGTW